MLMPNRPRSNYERQQDFLARHPGYYQRRYAKRKAATLTQLEQQQLTPATIAVTISVKKEPLMLPAPVEPLILPALKTIETLGVAAMQTAQARA